jgi:hypothetical protein
MKRDLKNLSDVELQLWLHLREAEDEQDRLEWEIEDENNQQAKPSDGNI